MAEPAAELGSKSDTFTESMDKNEDPVTSSEPGQAEQSSNSKSDDGSRSSAIDTPRPAKIDTSDAILNPKHLDSHPADNLHAPDSPTTSLVASLREQLSLLSEQAQQLNAKLVQSLSKHSDLEDTHFQLQRDHEVLQNEKGELEKFKLNWEENVNTGLFVERSQIKDEMQRLAAGLVEEERRRGSAEERRQKVEEEVDELAASLFDQANTMVAQERMGRLEAEERLKTTEENLTAAEAAVRDMQLHLQTLSTANAPGQSSTPQIPTITRKYLSSHLPYSEFTSFLSHLRLLRPIKEITKSTLPPPLVTNLLSQPFLARAISEDHDITLRLDVAPELSWLSRRGVSAAIVAGDLVIEPVSAASVISTSTHPISEIGCSLCGKPVFPNVVPQSPAVSQFSPPPIHPQRGSVSSSRFSLKPFFNTATSSPSALAAAQSPSASPLPSPNPLATPSSSGLPSVYIFRIAKSTTTGSTDKENKSYPLCKTGWCLERLRATCELWRFVRTGIVQVVWLGDDGHVSQATAPISRPVSRPVSTVVEGATEQSETGPTSSQVDQVHATDRPELPPRKRSGWGLGFKLSERSNSTGGGSSWTKGWGKSTASDNNSPPVSPGAGKRDSIGAGSLGAEKGNDEVVSGVEGTKEGLGAPLELKSSRGEITTEKDGGDTLSAPDAELKRTGSSVSVVSTNKSEKFATPTAEQSDPLDRPDIHQQENPEAALESKDEQGNPIPREINLSSPAPSATPPPIPRRAAGRNRASMISATTSGRNSPTGSAPPTPTVVEPSPLEPKVAKFRTAEEEEDQVDADALAMLESLRSEPDIAAIEQEQKEVPDPNEKKPEGVGEESATKVEEENKKDDEQEVEIPEPVDVTHMASPPPVPSTTRKNPPPPLPARHPKTPNPDQKGQNATRKGEQTFLPDSSVNAQDDESDIIEEDWESKTWKQVVKLKEAMWRTRIGVVEED